MTKITQVIQGAQGPAGAPGSAGDNIAAAGGLVKVEADGVINITPLAGKDIRFNTEGLGNLRVTGQTNLLLEGGDLLATGFEDAAPGRCALTNGAFVTAPGGQEIGLLDFVSFELDGGGPGPAANIRVNSLDDLRNHTMIFGLDVGAGIVDVLTFTDGAAVFPATLAWGGGQALASSDIFADYAGMRVFTGVVATVIPLVESWVKVEAFLSDNPAAVSSADFNTDALTVGGNGDYEIAFDAAASAASGNQVIHMAAFNVVASGTAITAATFADPVVITAPGHGLSNGQKVAIIDVVGMVELNERIFTVAGVAGDDFSLQDDGGAPIDGTGFNPWISAGTVHLATDTGIHSIRKYGSGGDVGAQASANVATLISGDTVELFIKNSTTAADITIAEANFFIHRLG